MHSFIPPSKRRKRRVRSAVDTSPPKTFGLKIAKVKQQNDQTVLEKIVAKAAVDNSAPASTKLSKKDRPFEIFSEAISQFAGDASNSANTGLLMAVASAPAVVQNSVVPAAGKHQLRCTKSEDILDMALRPEIGDNGWKSFEKREATPKVQLNIASISDLQRLLGLGPLQAAEVLRWRPEEGFTSWNQLNSIVGEDFIVKLRQHFTLEEDDVQPGKIRAKKKVPFKLFVGDPPPPKATSSTLGTTVPGGESPDPPVTTEHLSKVEIILDENGPQQPVGSNTRIFSRLNKFMIASDLSTINFVTVSGGVTTPSMKSQKGLPLPEAVPAPVVESASPVALSSIVLNSQSTTIVQETACSPELSPRRKVIVDNFVSMLSRLESRDMLNVALQAMTDAHERSFREKPTAKVVEIAAPDTSACIPLILPSAPSLIECPNSIIEPDLSSATVVGTAVQVPNSPANFNVMQTIDAASAPQNENAERKRRMQHPRPIVTRGHGERKPSLYGMGRKKKKENLDVVIASVAPPQRTSPPTLAELEGMLADLTRRGKNTKSPTRGVRPLKSPPRVVRKTASNLHGVPSSTH